MLAAPVPEIPRDGEHLFEPKWDGFRCLVFAEPGNVRLQSRTGKPLNRYFPEMLAAFDEYLHSPAVLDGELVVVHADADGDRLDWDALSERIHPADSRVRSLAAKTPAVFVAFDLLADGELDRTAEPLRHRRDRLTNLGLDHERLRTTPATRDPDIAAEWFRVFEGAGLDGLIAKPLDGRYQPGKRTALKIKHARTADCVVAGLRWYTGTEPGTAVGSLLLGLYDEQQVLHHVGVAGAFPTAMRRQLADDLGRLLTDDPQHPWLGEHASDGRRLPGSINRWRSSEQPWQPLRPERVVEVGYDHTEGDRPARFRHTTQFARWRPDRDPQSCGYAQLDEPARYDLHGVLNGETNTEIARGDHNNRTGEQG